jgi:hypothetical protein
MPAAVGVWSLGSLSPATVLVYLYRDRQSTFPSKAFKYFFLIRPHSVVEVYLVLCERTPLER